MTKPNAFTAPPKRDEKWLKQMKQSFTSSINSTQSAVKRGGYVVGGMGNANPEKTKIKN
jgi:hypothetical protein